MRLLLRLIKRDREGYFRFIITAAGVFFAIILIAAIWVVTSWPVPIMWTIATVTNRTLADRCGPNRPCRIEHLTAASFVIQDAGQRFQWKGMKATVKRHPLICELEMDSVDLQCPRLFCYKFREAAFSAKIKQGECRFENLPKRRLNLTDAMVEGGVLSTDTGSLKIRLQYDLHTADWDRIRLNDIRGRITIRPSGRFVFKTRAVANDGGLRLVGWADAKKPLELMRSWVWWYDIDIQKISGSETPLAGITEGRMTIALTKGTVAMMRGYGRCSNGCWVTKQGVETLALLMGLDRIPAVSAALAALRDPSSALFVFFEALSVKWDWPQEAPLRLSIVARSRALRLHFDSLTVDVNLPRRVASLKKLLIMQKIRQKGEE